MAHGARARAEPGLAFGDYFLPRNCRGPPQRMWFPWSVKVRATSGEIKRVGRTTRPRAPTWTGAVARWARRRGRTRPRAGSGTTGGGACTRGTRGCGDVTAAARARARARARPRRRDAAAAPVRAGPGRAWPPARPWRRRRASVDTALALLAAPRARSRAPRAGGRLRRASRPARRRGGRRAADAPRPTPWAPRRPRSAPRTPRALADASVAAATHPVLATVAGSRCAAARGGARAPRARRGDSRRASRRRRRSSRVLSVGPVRAAAASAAPAGTRGLAGAGGGDKSGRARAAAAPRPPVLAGDASGRHARGGRSPRRGAGDHRRRWRRVWRQHWAGCRGRACARAGRRGSGAWWRPAPPRVRRPRGSRVDAAARRATFAARASDAAPRRSTQRCVHTRGRAPRPASDGTGTPGVLRGEVYRLGGIARSRARARARGSPREPALGRAGAARSGLRAGGCRRDLQRARRGARSAGF